jgi:cell division protein FtsX
VPSYTNMPLTTPRISYTSISSTSPPTSYTSLPPSSTSNTCSAVTISLWLFGFMVFITTWLLLWLKCRADEREAYIKRHSGDDEDQAVKDNVKRIKRLMDRSFELQEQGLFALLCS